MKKISITLLICIAFISTHACEICGCGVGNYYLGMMPHFSHRFFGVRYHYNSFNTRLTDDPTQYSKDFYQTVELWTGWNIGKRVQVLALLPYNFNHQSSDEGVSNINGFGDVAVLANYKVLDVTSKTNSKVAQQLWFGVGIKAPTGKFEIDADDHDVAAVANNQRGSGSTDFMLNSMYNVQINKMGISTNVSYKINTNNKDEYKFGNKFSANTFVYYGLAAGKTMINPNIGFLYDHTEQSVLDHEKLDLTGGSILLGSAGVEVSFNKMAIGFNTQLPITQSFADGQTKSKIKGMAHITFAF